jgi:hypothetical protein
MLSQFEFFIVIDMVDWVSRSDESQQQKVYKCK